MFRKPIFLIIFLSGFAWSQRISEKKCAEYKDMYRKEFLDKIFGDVEYGDLNCPTFAGGTIVGGRVSKPSEFPGMASLLYEVEGSKRLSNKCGATLISDQFVLTAAHCLRKNAYPKKVALGEINLSPSPLVTRRRDIPVEDVIIHPGYKPPASLHDIALIKLSTKLTLHYGEEPTIRPACLATEELPTGSLLTATGWGRTSAGGDTSDVLMAVNLPITPRDECSDFFRDTLDFMFRYPGVSDQESWEIPETNICAGGQNGKDTCQGDSGGPLFYSQDDSFKCLRYVVGVTSFGSSDCGSPVPAVYTKVSAYLDWIESHVWPNE